MKVNNKTGRAFQPITIEITIESQDELYSLYHRANITRQALIGACKCSTSAVPFPESDEAHALYYALSQFISFRR